MEQVNKINQIIGVLGKPYYNNENVLIYNMDCKEGLLKLKENGIELDSTITSPPYNIGKEYENVLPVESFIDWLVEISDLIYDITKPSGSYLLNVGYLEVPNMGRAVPITYLVWNRIKFYLNQEIIWNYGAGVAARYYLSPRNEKILWYIKDKLNYTFNLDDIRDPDVKYPNQKKNGKLRCNTLGKNPSDFWEIIENEFEKGIFDVPNVKNAHPEKTEHPCQFPVEIAERCVLAFTDEDDWILDPFGGVGSTLIASIKNNRKAMSIDRDEKYSNIATQRVCDFFNGNLKLRKIGTPISKPKKPIATPNQGLHSLF